MEKGSRGAIKDGLKHIKDNNDAMWKLLDNQRIAIIQVPTYQIYEQKKW